MNHWFIRKSPLNVKYKLRVSVGHTIESFFSWNNRWNWIKNYSFITKKWFFIYRICRILMNAFVCSKVYLWGSMKLIELIGFSGILWDLSSISFDSLDSPGYYETYRIYLWILWILRDSMRLIEYIFGFSGFSGILWGLLSIFLDSLDSPGFYEAYWV